MADITASPLHNYRPEIRREPASADAFGVVERRLTIWEQIYASGPARKALILALLALVWEIYGRSVGNSLLFPTFSETVSALVTGLASGELFQRIWASLQVLLTGYALGILAAAVLTMVAISTRIGEDLMVTLTAMFSPLPAIALLPLALIWFGLGSGSLVFVLVHSVLWAVALNTFSGFQSTSRTLRMVGRNYGLKGWRFVSRILIPAALPSIVTGLKIGWAFAWRTLIAAEMVFGVSSGQGGLGWFIFQSKNMLDIPAVFAGLLSVILIGLFVEGVLFKLLEDRTVRRWAMQN
ncbi:NitT/TauT family transport system permease protein [Pararhizobium capsulatum DSM 1112]|uniref:NitT/TauT family transport system permease protein n=1 Tax=Pararhizobium capsulatum DSM 1112 TaxID=1121113 RepID=A0ABU0BQF7_9HYPH|nr:ABC transporter permease [Pararhizobium capsulatum]MDQ0319102.1 NitT/TauT family transport system permease protein [Pararhizobium capsulatum DSM 1112]